MSRNDLPLARMRHIAHGAGTLKGPEGNQIPEGVTKHKARKIRSPLVLEQVASPPRPQFAHLLHASALLNSRFFSKH